MNSTPYNWGEARRLQTWHFKPKGWSQRQIAEALASAKDPAVSG